MQTNNTGIGCTTPSAKLDLNISGREVVRVHADGTIQISDTATREELCIAIQQLVGLINFTSNRECRMTIHANGNVGIGTGVTLTQRNLALLERR